MAKPVPQLLPPRPYIYDALLVEVVDGDTIDVLVDEGLHDFTQIRVRFLGVYCPETDKPGGPEATAFTAAWLAACPPDRKLPLRITTVKDRTERYGRYLGTVLRHFDAANLTEALLQSGHGSLTPPVHPKPY